VVGEEFYGVGGGGVFGLDEDCSAGLGWDEGRAGMRCLDSGPEAGGGGCMSLPGRGGCARRLLQPGSEEGYG